MFPGFYPVENGLALQYRRGRLTGLEAGLAPVPALAVLTAPSPRRMVPLSVLDLSPVVSGSSGAVSLRNSIDLARLADRLGYHRYWVAEHHNLPSVASSAPEIMIGQIAAATERIRVGSGGVMLPNHAPLMVAERFKVLEALFPGRIDLGIGRAPGTDQVTSLRAAAAPGQSPAATTSWNASRNCCCSRTGNFPKAIRSTKSTRCRRTSRCRRSGCSARAATAPSLPPWSAPALPSRTISPISTAWRRCAAIASTSSRRPRWRSRTRSSAVAVVCADSDAEAERLPATLDLNWVRRARGEYAPLASPEEAQSYPYSPVDRERLRHRRARLFVGAPATVMAQLMPMIESTQADEVMVTTMIYDHAARRHSYELLAEAFALPAS